MQNDTNSSDMVKFSLSHAWNYFQLHAQQRMTVFNFYLVITGLIAAGLGACISQGDKLAPMQGVLGIFLSFITFIFWKLDQRVSFLIKRAEDSIASLETALETEATLFSNETQSQLCTGLSLKSPWTYGRSFRISFFVVGLVGLLFAINSLISLMAVQRALTCLHGLGG